MIFTENFDSIGDWNRVQDVVVEGGILTLPEHRSIGYCIRRQELDDRIVSLTSTVTGDPGDEDGSVTILFSRDRRHFTIADVVGDVYTVDTFNDTDFTCDFLDTSIAADFSKRTACVMVLLQRLSQPLITSVDPSSGGVGDEVDILGEDFRIGATVLFGGVPCTAVTYVSTSKLTVRTPTHGGGTVNVEVQNPDGQSATLSSAFTYSGPFISLLTPSTGEEGNSITIDGGLFVSGATVDFGGTSATSVVFVSASQITADIPAGTGSVQVHVTNPDSSVTGEVAASLFTYEELPAPPTPTGLGAIQAEVYGGPDEPYRGISLSWTASPGAGSYVMKRSLVSGGPYTIVNYPGGTTATDDDIEATTTYYYVVSAVNGTSGSGPPESANSTEASCTSSSLPHIP